MRTKKYIIDGVNESLKRLFDVKIHMENYSETDRKEMNGVFIIGYDSNNNETIVRKIKYSNGKFKFTKI